MCQKTLGGNFCWVVYFEMFRNGGNMEDLLTGIADAYWFE